MGKVSYAQKLLIRMQLFIFLFLIPFIVFLFFLVDSLMFANFSEMRLFKDSMRIIIIYVWTNTWNLIYKFTHLSPQKNLYSIKHAFEDGKCSIHRYMHVSKHKWIMTRERENIIVIKKQQHHSIILNRTENRKVKLWMEKCSYFIYMLQHARIREKHIRRRKDDDEKFHVCGHHDKQQT